MRPPRITRRRLVTALAVGVPAAIFGRPAGHLSLAAWRERGELPPVPDGSADDASRMNEVRVGETVRVSEAKAHETVADALARARAAKRPVCIAGARHTMGGHTSMADATVLDMAGVRAMRLDPGTNVLRVGAGARWEDVLRHLHDAGRSVRVMQSNSSFSIGGSLSANAHGWQHNRPPIASTVESFRLVKADGALVTCSRAENAELFAHVLGGYGLFGVILDVDLRVTENVMYRAERVACAADDYAEAFAGATASDEVQMAYGRLSVDAERFLTEALLTTFVRDRATPIPPLHYPEAPALKRAIFRGQVGSDYGKRLRWDLERWLGSEAGERVSRNQILVEPVGMFTNRRPDRTDVLHEYFVPTKRLSEFLAKARSALREHAADLLNVTIRNVDTDVDAALRYATEPVFSLVMLFSMDRTQAADDAMRALSRALVDAAIASGGRHYLPYRLHATREQVDRAYPHARAFFDTKRAHDPELLFRNRFWEAYG
jgi:FAD/FMN-containing dehydrogenase